MHWLPPSIADYYRLAKDKLRQEVESTPDENVIGLDESEWVEYLVQKYGMELIQMDETRQERMVEVVSKHGPAVRVEVPVVPSDTLEVIGREGLAGSPIWLTDYKAEFSVHSQAGTISQVATQDTAGIQRARSRIHEYIRSLNTAIDHENRSFPQEVRQVVADKRGRVQKKQRHLDDLEKAVGLPLVRQADISRIVPTAVKVREVIAPVVPPTPKRQERPVLESDKFRAILEVVDNQCRQFERTPGAFQALPEESLRDVILSSLNAVFQGAAVGEAFQGLGRADIHLRISQGEVFITEIKFWAGPASLGEVTGQLLERLTWREAYGVAIILSKNADFGHVLPSVAETIPTLPRFQKNTFRKVAENHFVSRFTLPSDESKQVEVHFCLYNLYTPRKAGRA